jgi:hypothetical protein
MIIIDNALKKCQTSTFASTMYATLRLCFFFSVPFQWLKCFDSAMTQRFMSLLQWISISFQSTLSFVKFSIVRHFDASTFLGIIPKFRMDFDKRKLGSASFIDSFTSTLDLFVIIATLAALIYLTVVTVVVTTGGICTAHNISSWQMCTSATCAKRN